MVQVQFLQIATLALWRRFVNFLKKRKPLRKFSGNTYYKTFPWQRNKLEIMYNRLVGRQRAKRMPNFLKNEHFLPPDRHAYIDWLNIWFWYMILQYITLYDIWHNNTKCIWSTYHCLLLHFTEFTFIAFLAQCMKANVKSDYIKCVSKKKKKISMKKYDAHYKEELIKDNF